MPALERVNIPIAHGLPVGGTVCALVIENDVIKCSELYSKTTLYRSLLCLQLLTIYVDAISISVKGMRQRQTVCDLSLSKLHNRYGRVMTRKASLVDGMKSFQLTWSQLAPYAIKHLASANIFPVPLQFVWCVVKLCFCVAPALAIILVKYAMKYNIKQYWLFVAFLPMFLGLLVAFLGIGQVWSKRGCPAKSCYRYNLVFNPFTPKAILPSSPHCVM